MPCGIALFLSSGERLNDPRAAPDLSPLPLPLIERAGVFFQLLEEFGGIPFLDDQFMDAVRLATEDLVKPLIVTGHADYPGSGVRINGDRPAIEHEVAERHRTKIDVQRLGKPAPAAILKDVSGDFGKMMAPMLFVAGAENPAAQGVRAGGDWTEARQQAFPNGNERPADNGGARLDPDHRFRLLRQSEEPVERFG